MHILNNHDCVRFGHLRIWADNGLIKIEDDRDGGYEVISIRSGLQRMVALSEMLKNSRRDLHEAGALDRTAYDDIMRMLEEMTTVCRKAQQQGSPDDPNAKNWLRQHGLKPYSSQESALSCKE